MVDADALTAIRTAAASAVATRALALDDAATLAIIGTGEQALSHIEAIQAVRDIRDIRIAGRTPARALEFVRALPKNMSATACNSAQEAVQGADIICTVTSAPTPILHGDWVANGTHINADGASVPTVQEIDQTLLLNAALFTDYRPSTLAQAREILTAISEGKMEESHILGEIGEALSGKVRGRRTPEDITLYRSLGITAQDLICADYVRHQRSICV